MKIKLTKKIATVICALTLINAAKAQFNGNFMPINWAFSQINAAGNIDTTNAPNSISLIGSDNGSGISGTSDLNIIMPQAGFITFSWSYSTTDAAASDYPQYLLNGNAVTLENFNMNGLNNQTDVQSCIAVEAGDVFGFRTVTTDNLNGAAVTIFSSFNFNPVSISPQNATLCFGDSLSLTASGAINYLWSDGILNGVIFTPTISNNYTVIASILGCTTTATGYVMINALPNVVITGGNAICAGSNATLNASGALNYSWSTGSLNDTIVVAPVNVTTYSVFATDVNGCSNNASQILNVNALPNVLATSSSSLICIGQTVTLTANGALTYTWNNQAGVGAVVTITPNANTLYNVWGTDLNGCTNSALITQNVSVCSALQDIEATQQTIKIFPNPNNGEFWVSLGSVNENTFIEIYNVFGQLIVKEALNNLETLININKVSSGLYQIKITENNKTIINGKVIKQ